VIDGVDEVVDGLTSTADTLADLALDRLHRAAEVALDDRRPAGATDPSSPLAGEQARLLAEEKALTRARRAVEKAVHILARPSGGDPGS